jgi:hypothetical protein
MSGSWFPVLYRGTGEPVPTGSREPKGTTGNHSLEKRKNQRFVRPIARRMPGGSRVGGNRSASAHLRYVPSTGKCHGKPKDCRCSPAVQSVFGLRDWDRIIDHLGLSRIEEEKPCLCPRRFSPLSMRSRSHRRWSRAGSIWSRDAVCAEMIWCARRSTTVGQRGQLRHDRARTHGRQCRTRQV